jgi:DNA mismatch repair protein MutS
LAIAWAVVEYLHDTPGLAARTLFATHFHELTDLAQTKERVQNAHFEAREWKNEVVFLRRLVPGGANRSYGIQVAKLAGLPDSIVARAKQILENLEGGEFDEGGWPRLAGAPHLRSAGGAQISLFRPAGSESLSPDASEILDELRSSDPDRITPLEALAILQRWRERLVDGGERSS